MVNSGVEPLSIRETIAGYAERHVGQNARCPNGLDRATSGRHDPSWGIHERRARSHKGFGPLGQTIPEAADRNIHTKNLTIKMVSLVSSLFMPAPMTNIPCEEDAFLPAELGIAAREAS
jgi:hypothetical protein